MKFIVRTTVTSTITCDDPLPSDDILVAQAIEKIVREHVTKGIGEAMMKVGINTYIKAIKEKKEETEGSQNR